MNRHQKEKSREIKDIMRTDRFGRMTYKEARRQWKKGVRELPVTAISAGAAKRGLRLEAKYDPMCAAHKLLFRGYTFMGGCYVYTTLISDTKLRLNRVPRGDLARFILGDLNDHMHDLLGVNVHLTQN